MVDQSTACWRFDVKCKVFEGVVLDDVFLLPRPPGFLTQTSLSKTVFVQSLGLQNQGGSQRSPKRRGKQRHLNMRRHIVGRSIVKTWPWVRGGTCSSPGGLYNDATMKSPPTSHFDRCNAHGIKLDAHHTMQKPNLHHHQWRDCMLKANNSTHLFLLILPNICKLRRKRSTPSTVKYFTITMTIVTPVACFGAKPTLMKHDDLSNCKLSETKHGPKIGTRSLAWVGWVLSFMAYTFPKA